MGRGGGGRGGDVETAPQCPDAEQDRLHGFATTEVSEAALLARKGVGEMRPSAFLNHPSVLLYMVLKWAGLRRVRLFSSQIRVAKGVSVYSVVNLPTNEPSRLIRARRIWV